VDSLGGVRGVDRLRVVDASIIPEVPSSTTNLTVIMLAERIFQRAYAPTPSPAGALRRDGAG
jgi:choline dehydrogenase